MTKPAAARKRHAPAKARSATRRKASPAAASAPVPETAPAAESAAAANDGFAKADAGAGAQDVPLEAGAAREAAEQILGANPLLGFDKAQILDAALRALR